METTTQVRRGIHWLPAIVGFLAAMGLGTLLAFGVSHVRGDATNLAREPAPDFTLPLYSGGTGQFTLSEQRGHPVVLNFWASWCPPCRIEFPALQAAADKYKDQGLVVFGVDVQDTEADAKAFLEEQGTTFLTGPDLTGQISLDYAITNLPTTFFITRDGRTYKKWVGKLDETRLNTFIEELLKL